MMDISLFSTVSRTLDHANVSDGFPWSPVPTWGFGVVVVGALILLGSFIPGFVTVVKTKNTASLSWVMWLVTVIGLFFLVMFYLLGTIDTANANNGTPAPHFLLVLLCEGISMILSIYILVYKFINMSRAKASNVSEAEFCKRLAQKRRK